jgi:hypothetical protein
VGAMLAHNLAGRELYNFLESNRKNIGLFIAYTRAAVSLWFSGIDYLKKVADLMKARAKAFPTLGGIR